MKKIRLAFVGSGFNGQIGFIQNFHKNKNCEIAGLAEARPKLLEKVSKKFGIKNKYSSHKGIIHNINKFDGVVIVTKRNMLPAIAYDFLKLGKPVLTEKPMASSLLQAKKLIQVSNQNRTLYKVGYNKTYDEGVQKSKSIFKKILKKKILGKIVFIRSHRLSGSGYDSENIYIKTNEKNLLNKPEWKAKPNWLPKKFERTYAKFLNLYCHNINLFKYFTNIKPKIIFSDLSDTRMSTVILDYGNFRASLETGFFTKNGWDETFEIFFEHGHIKIILHPQHKKNKGSTVLVYENSKNKFTKRYTFKSWSFKRQSDAFINDIKTKSVKQNNAKAAVEDIEIIESIWKRFIKKNVN